MATESKENAAATTLSDGEIIDRFGGIRPMAAKLGVAFTTVQGWKVRGHIPQGRRQAILDAAAKHGIDLGGAPAPAQPPEPERKTKEVPAETEEVPVETVSASPAPPPQSPREEPTEPEPEPEPAVQTMPPAPPRGGGIAWLALLAALAVGVALVARPWWEPLVYPPEPTPGGNAQSAEAVAEIRALGQVVKGISGDLAGRLDTLDGRIAAVERSGGGGDNFAPQLLALEQSLTSLASGLDSIGATLARLEARIVALESASAEVPDQVEAALRENAAALAASRAGWQKIQEELRQELASALEHMTALQARVEELESRPVQTGDKIAALALAVGQVEAALNSGKPYRNALNRLETIARDDPSILEGGAIAALAPWADYGIPGRAALQRRFARISADITDALVRTDSVTWLDRLWDSVSTVVTVRRVEGAADLSPVSQAEAALADDDLAAAVAALAGQGSLGEDGDAWLALAENRIRAEAEIAALYARVILPLAGQESATQ